VSLPLTQEVISTIAAHPRRPLTISPTSLVSLGRRRVQPRVGQLCAEGPLPTALAAALIRSARRPSPSTRRRVSAPAPKLATRSLASFRPTPVASRKRLIARMRSPLSSASRTCGGTSPRGSYWMPWCWSNVSILPSSRDIPSKRADNDEIRWNRSKIPEPRRER